MKKKGIKVLPGQASLFDFPQSARAAAEGEANERLAGPAAEPTEGNHGDILPPRVSLSEETQTLMQERGLSHGEPCPKCACELYWNLPYTSYGEQKEDIVCVRCYPKKGYHQYSDQVDRYYPRRW